jgi:hypothetical protein
MTDFEKLKENIANYLVSKFLATDRCLTEAAQIITLVEAYYKEKYKGYVLSGTPDPLDVAEEG